MHFDDIMRVLHAIYDAAAVGEGWQDVLVEIADLTRTENAALVLVDPSAGLSSVVAPRADPDLAVRYSQFWWQKDPTAQATAETPVGVLTTLQDTGRERFFSSEFYNDFWRNSGLGAERIAANLFTDEGAFASFVLQASCRNDEIDEDALRAMQVLVPHLVRAANIQRRMNQLYYQHDLARAAAGTPGVGALLVDDRARLIFADETGETVLRARDDLILDHGTIRFGLNADTVRLHRLVASCSGDAPVGVRGGNMTTTAVPGSEPLSLDVLPYHGEMNRSGFHPVSSTPPAAIVLVGDRAQKQAAARGLLQQQYGLTPAECSFALEIVKADGRKAAAERLGISLSTARTHLSRVFEKTGVNRQAELVRLLSAQGIEI